MILFFEQYAEQIIMMYHHTKFELASSKHLKAIQLGKKRKKGGFRGDRGGQILFREQYTEQIIMSNHHTKFELASFKRLEVIQS